MFFKKIILLFITLFIYSFAFSQLSNQNKVTIGKWVLDENLPKCIEVELKGNVGNYPNWDGFFSIVNDLSKSVQNKLRSTQPYKVVPYQSVLKTNFTVIDTNYTRIKNSGNLLILGITLQECTEKERDWYFDFFALLYPATQSVSKNTLDAESEPVMFRYSNIESRIDRKWNDIQTIEHLNYPSPESYKIITNLVIGPKYKNEVEYQEYLSLQKTNENKPIQTSSSSFKNVLEEKKAVSSGSINSVSNIPGTFVLTERCKLCYGDKFLIDEKSDICLNCRYWDKSRKEYDFCHICKNFRRYNITQQKIKCSLCNGLGIKTTKVSNTFKSLVYDFLDAYPKYNENKKIYPFTFGIKGKMNLQSAFENSLYFLMEKDLDHITLHFDGKAVYKIFENDKEYTGNWHIMDDKIYIDIPNVITFKGDPINIQIIKNKKK